MYTGLCKLDIITLEFMSFRSVGAATAAFAIAVLERSTQPGVWFPEEVCTINHLDIKKLRLYFLDLVCNSLTAKVNRVGCRHLHVQPTLLLSSLNELVGQVLRRQQSEMGLLK